MHTHRIHTMSTQAKREYIAIMTKLDSVLTKEHVMRMYLLRLKQPPVTSATPHNVHTKENGLCVNTSHTTQAKS